MYFWGISPVLVANYRFNSQTGVIVPDASRKLGPGYLGASTTISIDATTAPAYSTTVFEILIIFNLLFATRSKVSSFHQPVNTSDFLPLPP